MEIMKLTGETAIEEMTSHVARALDSPEIHVFQVLGYFGIGKRTAIRALFEDRGIVPVEHDYTIIEIATPIIETIKAYPDAVHLWDDVFRSNIMHPEVLSALQAVQKGALGFNGTFLLVANDMEFADGVFPPFPGVHVDFADTAMLLKHLEHQMRSESSNQKEGQDH